MPTEAPLHLHVTQSLACVSGELHSDDKATDKSSMFQLFVLCW